MRQVFFFGYNSRMDQVLKIRVDNSTIDGAGRGIFATQDIKKDEVVEICPFVEIDSEEVGGTLASYVFFFGDKKQKSGLMLGYGSLYNHSKSPNAKIEINETDRFVRFIAIKDIKKGEEITFDYYNGKEGDPLWFEV